METSNANSVQFHDQAGNIAKIIGAAGGNTVFTKAAAGGASK